MNSTQASEISDLWAMHYSPTMSANNAAGLQIAIWEILGGNKFSVLGNDYGAGAMLAQLNSFTGKGARLIAVSGPGQDYVVAGVPDTGSTLSFLRSLQHLPWASHTLLDRRLRRIRVAAFHAFRIPTVLSSAPRVRRSPPKKD